MATQRSEICGSCTLERPRAARKGKKMSYRTEREETIHTLAREGWSLAAIRKLLRAATAAQRAAIDECNGPPSHLRDEHGARAWIDALAKRSARAARSVELAVKGQPHECVEIHGDPRGYVVKLKLASGRYNTWGGPDCGWGIPANVR